MKITEIETYVLLADNYDPSLTSSAQDTCLVIIKTDEGIEGYGECDTSPWVAKAFIESPGTHTMDQCVKDILIGSNPLDINKLWSKIYVGSAMTGRRGAGVNAISAIDMALWDIKGKYENKPVFELLGGKKQNEVIPYASLQPVGHSFQEYKDSLVEWAKKAKDLGFKAVKSEVTLNGPYAHSGLKENDDKTTEVVQAVRNALGPEIKLMIDVQYRWLNADEALPVVKEWKDFDIYFLETPVWTDDIKSYARMHDEAPMKIAAGEWLSTRYEFEDLIVNGKIDVAQPDVGRCGGLTESKIIADMSQKYNRIIVPHCWKTSISISATAHFAFNTPNCAFIEYLPPQLCVEVLRKELATEGFDFKDGKILPPTKPGLGIELNKDAIKKYQVG
ncbi:MAG: D-galactarolactone cycloisomerase [Alphaproteobacteria bacterium MarineAlpha5_Bin6]|nr:MAG: D-galactarolactone cycloisomerase [Alphaproteobacteria bacterium MarineAlpha5_Bin6]|tara:strand:- start:1309 stop:2478 length:1170 start_codon:yes stop_codon:yes gene_type:complete